MRFLLLMTVGLIRVQVHRRMVMFVVLVTALVLLFFGSTFLEPYLVGKPITFVLYWLSCLWLTFLALLLAAYDLLMVRKAARIERERLRQTHLTDSK